jgi:phytoene dehydrogenase-like protein
MPKKVAIIGAGIAGLSTGCYAQMNGYDSEIFEMHDLPGGLCTAWERKDYIFDGCIHYLFGSGEGQPFNQMWHELGAIQGRLMIDHDELMRVVDQDGRTFVAYCDPDRLEAHLHELSPADAELASTFAAGVRQFRNFDMSALQMKPRRLMSAADWLAFNQAVLPYLGTMARWGRFSARRFAERFQDPLLRASWKLIFGWEDIPLVVGMFLLAYMANRNAGFPAGGSLAFAEAIARRYEALGGKIHYKAQVEKILVDGNKVTGLRLYDDSIHAADAVISAADGRNTLYGLLGEKHVNASIQRLYEGDLPLHSQIQVSLGVKRDMTAEPHWATYLLEEPELIGGLERHTLGVKHYSFDPSLAPTGKAAIEVMLESTYGYWQRIYGRRLYDTEQRQVCDQIIAYLEHLYPGIASQIEVTDVATPLSYERYTGNWLGSTCGWLLTDKLMVKMIVGLPKQLRALENFYMAGQWVEPGGSVPVVAMSGRNAVQLLCSADGKPFETTVG